MEKVWNIAKRDLLVLKYYTSFADLKNKISAYFRTKRFNLNMRNYLLMEVRQHMLIGIVLQQSALKIELNFLMITLIVKRRYKIKRINN